MLFTMACWQLQQQHYEGAGAGVKVKKLFLILFPIIVSMLLVTPMIETKAYADTLPQATDLSQPGFIDIFSFIRQAGKEEAVYFQIPASQISTTIELPSDPSPLILAKYEREKAKGTIFLMRIWQAGPWIRGEIQRITPRDFKHFLGPSLYNFAFLNWNPNQNATCEAQKASKFPLGTVQSPGVDILNEIEKQFMQYDAKVKEYLDAGYDKTIAQSATYNPTASIRLLVGNPAVTTTVKYFVYPEYYMVFPHRVSQSYGEFQLNPGNSIRSTSYDFIKVKGNHTFPIDETLVYQWSQTKKGWTGLAVFLGGTLLGLLTGGLGALAGLGEIAIILGGGAIGGVGGLMASGFSPTTSTTAHFTPFVYSKYQLDPSQAYSGDAKRVADEIFNKWLSPNVQNTPGGVGVFVSRIDMRKAVLCGSISNADQCSTGDAIVQIHASDPRYWSIFNEMFHHASQELLKYKYPFTTK
ncbi:hypothetical protein V4D30_01190 [Thermodesulfovibrio sp. 3907-1M]|uniref:Uncharacterized protein n=1 Tax=Thermodesulfovibrio autotrophicus TaxID=3118333 RepID=A0AAU8GZU2_9BACT